MEGDFRPAYQPAKSLRKSHKESFAETKIPSESLFKTPEEVAASEEVSEIPKPESDSSDKQPDKKPSKFKIHLTKKQWVIVGIVFIFILTLGGLIYAKTSQKPVAQVTTTKKVKKLPPKPTTVPSTLTGLQVDPAVNQRPVTGVMIENSLEARPQSGLSEAGVVFEAIAEGGITRFLALFQDTAPADIGPVRSARPYYAQWAMGFDAGYAHVGGSPEALANIRAWGTKDLDQFANGGSYRRITTRAAPHNVYTSIAALNELESKKGYTASVYAGFPRKKATPAKIPTAKTIDLAISSQRYNVHYDYVSTTNSYNRVLAGATHIDANNNKQISPSVVVGLIVPYSLASDRHHSQYQVIGSGQAFIFQDGIVTAANWTKPDIKSQITFTDASGKPVLLNPGQTWLTALSAATKVTYAP